MSQTPVDPNKMSGSSMFPGRVMAEKLDTNVLQIGDEFFNRIDQDLKSGYGDHRSVPSSKAVIEIIAKVQSALEEIDPDNNFFKDNSVLSDSIIPPKFTGNAWELLNWIIEDGNAIYSHEEGFDSNYLKIPTEHIPSAGIYFMRIDIERVDTGNIQLVAYDDTVIKTFDVRGTYYLELEIKDPNIESLKFVSNGLYPGEVAMITYVGMYRVTDRFYHYMQWIISNIDGGGGTGGDVSREEFNQLKTKVDSIQSSTQQELQEMADLLSIHVDDFSNPHKVTRAILQAAAVNHTHTLTELGAAAEVHNHQPEECGAAPEEHFHLPEQCGSAPEHHTHTPDECGAAPEEHNHDDRYPNNTRYSQDQQRVDQQIVELGVRMDNLDGGSGIMPGTDVSETPLSVLASNPDCIGHAFRVVDDTPQELQSPIVWNDRPGFLDMFEQNIHKTYSNPIHTLCGGILHTSKHQYDLHSGIVTFTPPAGLITTPSQYTPDSFLPLHEVYDFVRFDIDFVHHRIAKCIPMIIDGTGTWKINYEFHAPQVVRGMYFYRDNFSNMCSASNYQSKIYSATNVTITVVRSNGATASETAVLTWGANERIYIGLQNSNIFEDVVGYSITVNTISADFPDSGYPYGNVSVNGTSGTMVRMWTFAVSPNVSATKANIDANVLSIRPNSTIVGHVHAGNGILDLPIELDTNITIDNDWFIRNNQPISPYGMVFLHQPYPSDLTGDVVVEPKITLIPLEITKGKPKGCLAFEDSIVSGSTLTSHPYWGTYNKNLNSHSTDLYETFTSASDIQLIQFDHMQTVSGLNALLEIDQFDINNVDINIKLTKSNEDNTSTTTTLTYPLAKFVDTFPKRSTNVGPGGVGGGGTIRHTRIANLDIEFAELQMRVMSVNMSFTFRRSTTVKVYFAMPRVVGLHYDPKTRTLKDYEFDTTPIGIIGHFVSVYNPVYAENKYIPLAIFEDIKADIPCPINLTNKFARSSDSQSFYPLETPADFIYPQHPAWTVMFFPFFHEPKNSPIIQRFITGPGRVSDTNSAANLSDAVAGLDTKNQLHGYGLHGHAFTFRAPIFETETNDNGLKNFNVRY